MAYRVEKDTGDIVIDGWETGIAPSPHKGIANIQNGNISTETGEVTAAFARTKQSQTPITNGTLTASSGAGTTLLATSSPLNAGQWINVSAATIQVPSIQETVTYLVQGGGAGGGGSITNGAGGGGAGDYVPGTTSVSAAAYTITIGGGGNGGAGGGLNNGAAGVASSFGAIASAPGGSGGGAANGGGGVGNNGSTGTGSGGGGGSASGGGTGGSAGAAGTGVNVHAGGAGNASSVGGGGGGSSTAGTTGAAGAGTSNSITGGAVTYGAGGTPGVGNAAATANSGNGGGGGTANSAGGNGGSGIVIISYPTGNITATGGTITTSGGNTIHSFTTSGTFTVTSINTTRNLPTGAYYVSWQDTNGRVKISNFYDPNATISLITHGTSGTATFSTTPNMASPLAKATEVYSDGTTTQYRYYILDSTGLVWVYDTALYASSLAASGVGTTWFLPDKSVAYFAALTAPTGVGILNGWLFVAAANSFFVKPTVNLGDTTTNTTTYTLITQGLPSYMNGQPSDKNPHFLYTGHQGRMYYTDKNYIGAFFPDTSIQTGTANIQSYSSYTAATNVGTVTTVFSGSMPITFDSAGAIKRIPAVFFIKTGGTQPTNLTAGTVYWIGVSSGSNDFGVYAAQTGGAAIDIQAGAIGTQYFNTFYPLGTDAAAGGTHTTMTFNPQRLNLPAFEVAQTIAEVGNTVLIGCKGNVVYPWGQVKVTPDGIINLPEKNVTQIVTVNQMGYLFAGNNGNVYITDGSTSSLVLNVPDYCAGVPGSPGTYIESTYYFGGAEYIRGRVYFSVLDQSTTKTGNCGGIWSFVPTQNLYIGQDTGIALRLEAQNSYATYNGVAPIIINAEVQNSQVPLYWAAWYSDVSTPTYGIDYSSNGTLATSPAVVETDAMPTGTMLTKKTFRQIEYKLGTALDATATITAKYRQDITAAWTACDTFQVESNGLSGYTTVNFEKGQWLQLQFTLTPATSSADTNTFIRFREVRVR